MSVDGVLSTAAIAACTLPWGEEHASKAPSATTKGEVYQWKSADGLPFEYYVPKSYDPKVGTNLTLVLHGNGLNFQWTFWNHPPGEFRAEDIVVSPEGTTFLENTKAFEFLGDKKDADRVHALLTELKSKFNVRATFLYGHSQGSFFVFEYAGIYPEDVNGVVGHSGALWASSRLGKFGHRQAIAFMHGTDDANVPYFQSVDGRAAYRAADYPNVHLRTLWNWPHAPNWVQAQNQLAWCEGMTSTDPARVAAAQKLLEARVNGGIDLAALYAVCARLATLEGATSVQRAAGEKTRVAVETLTQEVVNAIEKSLGKSKLTKMDGRAWLGLTRRLLEDCDGVPPTLAFLKTHAADLAAVDKQAESAGKEFWRSADKDPAKALGAGLDLTEKGWRNPGAGQVQARLAGWLEKATELKLGKKEAARARAMLADAERGQKEGFAAFESIVKGLD